jgi:hypothetical protein
MICVPRLVRGLGHQGDLAVIVHVADAGEAFMHDAVLEHDRLQIAHENGAVREDGVELGEQRFIFRQDRADGDLVLSLAVQVPTYWMG